MEINGKIFNTIDDYISQFGPEVQEKLREMRAIIKSSAPDAQEIISWQMPTFFMNGNLAHFAAHKRHIGFYPGATGVAKFSDRLSGYKTTKGAIQFPFDQPLPAELINDIIKFKLSEQAN